MIHAFNFTCNRDFELSLLMMTTYYKYCPSGTISITNTDVTPAYKDYGNGAGWNASMMKLKALSDIVKTKRIKDDDYILSVDSDVVFTSSEVFSYVKDHGIIGTKHHPEFNTINGRWSHMSGALIFIRGDIAKAMVNMNEDNLNRIRFKHFKPFDLTENEDVVLSYLASHVGANQFDIGGIGLSSGDFEGNVQQKDKLKSFYHLNYCPTMFLGEQVNGKWDIPSVLKKKGIEL